MFIFDWHYVLYVLIPTLIISGSVQMYLKSTYAKWRQVRNSSGATGARSARRCSSAPRSRRSRSGKPKASSTDNFDPRAGVVNLSQAVATQPSVASMAIVAHELGPRAAAPGAVGSHGDAQLPRAGGRHQPQRSPTS